MIDEVLQVGDEVTITIPEENRKWGYNPCPDGTKAKVVGFSEIAYGRIDNCGLKPGIYTNRAWTKLLLEDGREHTELSSRLKMVNNAEYEQRDKEWRKENTSKSFQERKEFLRDLPETPFWEGDKVRVRARSALTVCTSEMPPKRDPDIFVVVGINYAYLNDRTKVGTKYPAYTISEGFGAGWHTSASEDDMELVERGNVWKFYHDEHLSFSDLREEAQFFMMLGHSEEVRNPKNGLYKWTKEEVLEAIKNGIVHGFTLGHGLFEFVWDPPTRLSAYRFRDENLGRRLARSILQGFGISA